MQDNRQPPATGVTRENLATESTLALLERVRTGDDTARNALFSRCLPVLERWARGRLPTAARDLVDTHDLVQDAVVSTLHNLERFQYQHPGAFNAYLREAVLNRIRDHLRRVKRRPLAVSLDDAVPDGAATPLDYAIGRERLAQYEAALARLNDMDRAAIVTRFELQCSYDEVAVALAKPTANAARVAVVRALERLVRELDRAR